MSNITKPMISISGVRGIVDNKESKDSFYSLLADFTCAFAQYTKLKTKKDNCKIVIGRDTRKTGPEILDITASNLKNLNLFVHDTKKPFDFLNKKFDLIYSNLALQFFNLSQLDSIFFNISNLMNDDSLFLFSTKKPGDKYFNFGNKISDHAFEYKGITRFFFDKSELEDVLKNYFNIIFLQDDKHVNQDGTESVWWKILVKK